MTVTAREYASLKAFFAAVLPAVLPSLPPEADPLVALEAIEARSMGNARRGLGMAIGDMMEMTREASAEWVAATDATLLATGLPSFSSVRARFDRRVRSILRRGTVRDEDEFYALRNAVEAMPEAEQSGAWTMLDTFEAKVGGR